MMGGLVERAKAMRNWAPMKDESEKILVDVIWIT